MKGILLAILIGRCHQWCVDNRQTPGTYVDSVKSCECRERVPISRALNNLMPPRVNQPVEKKEFETVNSQKIIKDIWDY